MEWIEHAIAAGDVFYDIGANVGAYSLIAAKATGNRARIFAFEPPRSSFHDLSRNVLLNDCSESVVCLPLALWSGNRPLSLTSSLPVAGAARHRISDQSAKEPDAVTIWAPAWTIWSSGSACLPRPTPRSTQTVASSTCSAAPSGRSHGRNGGRSSSSSTGARRTGTARSRHCSPTPDSTPGGSMSAWRARTFRIRRDDRTSTGRSRGPGNGQPEAVDCNHCGRGDHDPRFGRRSGEQSLPRLPSSCSCSCSSSSFPKNSATAHTTCSGSSSDQTPIVRVRARRDHSEPRPSEGHLTPLLRPDTPATCSPSWGPFGLRTRPRGREDLAPRPCSPRIRHPRRTTPPEAGKPARVPQTMFRFPHLAHKNPTGSNSARTTDRFWHGVGMLPVIRRSLQCLNQEGEPARVAATASSRELTPRARKSRRMWFLTVSVLRWSSAAICFVERPCSRRRSTST